MNYSVSLYFISVLNHVNIDKLKICLEEKGKTEKEYKAYIKLKIKKYPGHQTSIDLYENWKLKHILLNVVMGI